MIPLLFTVNLVSLIFILMAKRQIAFCLLLSNVILILVAILHYIPRALHI